ncbi:MAG TPA: hypothetical protein VF540_06985 [Segetibacter sp.]|jgi:hypothetical protein
MNTLRNIVLALCIGSIVAIVVNMRIGPEYKFSSTAFALGFFVFSAVFAIKPIRPREEGSSGLIFRSLAGVKNIEGKRADLS